MQFIHLILHLDKYLTEVVYLYHNYFYIILFLVIFAETGLVVTPFLPGDSLLFVAGSLASSGNLDFAILSATIFVAAFLGDNSNFFIGLHVQLSDVITHDVTFVNSFIIINCYDHD